VIATLLTEESLALLDHVADGVAVTRAGGTIAYCSRPLAAMLGQQAKHTDQVSIFCLVESVAPEALGGLHERTLSSGRVQRIMVRCIVNEVQARVVMRRAIFQDVHCVVWSFEDVSEGRETLPDFAVLASAIQEGSSRPEFAAQRAEFGFWDVKVESDELTWWNDWCNQHDIDPCSGAGHGARWDATIHPDDLAGTNGYHDVIAGRSEIYEAEFRVRTRSGAWLWISSRGMATARDADGKALRLTGVTIDIDARKRTALALRESEARLEAVVWGTELGLWEVRADGSCWWFNDWCELHGIEPYDNGREQRVWLERIHPADAPLYKKLSEEAMHGITDHYVVEFRIMAREGGWRWVHERGRVTQRDPSGEYLVMVGVCLDVDAHKRMEIAVRESEARLATILETMREGVVLVDGEGCVEFTNPAFDRMFGHEHATLKGIPFLKLLDFAQDLETRAIDRWLARFSARGGTRAINLRRADGGEFSGEILTGSIEVSGSKKTLYVVQDVSERKQLEKEITESAHRERRRLGSDLHDGLGQELTGISLMLRSVALRVETGGGDARSVLDDTIALVNHAIQTTRKMAMGLSPVTLERGGIAAALGTLAAWSRSTLGCEVRLRLSTSGDFGIDEAGATNLYMIAQEAILNAAKHGRARSILVSLSTAKQLINLVISDDGIGVGTAGSRGVAPGRGMGLKIMRYRAGVLGGTLQVKRRKGGGTRVHCVCPLGRRSSEPDSLPAGSVRVARITA